MTTETLLDNRDVERSELQELVRRIRWTKDETNLEPLLTREWLVTGNQLSRRSAD